ncbi:Uncharacterised protein [Vibrio cholerae]|nr:Uncharacterised protein [Vibrio cholerae]
MMPGFCVSILSSASRICRPGTERHEPFSLPSPPSANAITGRWYFSLMREARMPITPWCQSR